MKPNDPVKIVSQLLDLPLIDKAGRWCGVVDDVEFDGAPGKPTRIVGLLAGPGAYQRRLPGWAFWIVRKIGGDHVTRVPVDAIETIAAAVHLKRTAEDLKLYGAEDRARRWIPRKWAL